MHKTSVLIVGAGPTGLMMACQLSMHHTPFIIVDKESGPTTQSRAIGIQARSLEIFAQMGIVETFLKHGYQAHGLNYVTKGKVIQHILLKGLGENLTEFPYLLIHEQAKTENVLIEFIENYHHTIHWNTEVLSFTQDETKITAKIKTKTGAEETIEADWIVGADGAHSIVRHTLGIELAGKTYKQSLFVLDCKIRSNLPKDELTVAFSDTSFAALFPMTNDRWRIVGEVPAEAFAKNEITFEEVEKTFAQQMQMDILLFDPAWISLYHSHHRCVEKFRSGRAFLLGDAAHIHSPVGAQGMNTGLQDAYNLAWKLAFVEKKCADESILDTYNAERLPFAKKLVETTDRMFNLIASGKKVAIFLREYIVPKIIQQIVTHKKSGKFFFRTISQIGISYHSSPLSQHATVGKFGKGTARPGDRLPYGFFEHKGKEMNIQSLVNPTKFHLFIFPGKENCESFQKELKPYEKILEQTEIPHAKNKLIYQQFGIKNSGYYLIRPDMYIAFRSDSLKVEELKRYLSRFFQ